MKKFLLLYHTLKYLKWPQFYFRIYRKFVKPKVTERFEGSVPQRNSNWVNFQLYDEKITDDYKATFLNHTKSLDLPLGWNDESISKLWVYNLHYFEDVLAKGAEYKYSFHIQLLDNWIEQNPVGKGNGWEPYTISLRLPNLLKAWQAGLPLEKKHFTSLYAQASYLSNDLEKHLLGNHYFVNLKALLFAGVIFNNYRWKKIAIRGLQQEIPEQILSDGANFELTPMYHSLILVDMLDMYNLVQAYPESIPDKLSNVLRVFTQKMLGFMVLMAHNDDGVSFFNDSVNGVAPDKAVIEEYAKSLGFKIPRLDCSITQAIDSVDSGYMVATHSGSKLIFDAAKVGPDYIPGHAHADTLSFELSIGNERVFVNTGTSQYGISQKRLNERKTYSHNTIEVDSMDSSQVWSGFRVAKRARVIERSAKVIDNSVLLQATHDGYKAIKNGPLHTRKIILGKNSLSVSDILNGKFESAKARFYFHPELEVQKEDRILLISGKSFKMQADLTDQEFKLLETAWHPGFGLSLSNKCLEINFTKPVYMINFTWTSK